MLFKNLARPPQRLPQRPIFRRQTLILIAGVFFFIFIVPTLFLRHKKPKSPPRPQPPPPAAPYDDRLSAHVLTPEELAHFRIVMPAPSADVNLCKTLLTGSVLGYPVPTLVAYEQTFNKTNLVDGGSHLAKISGVLDWLDGLPVSANDDLVMVMDAYDIWFQLRVEVLLQRYHSLNAQANERMKEQLGKAVEKENLKQTVIFGASKRCAPNQPHTVACYSAPESPLPFDVYGVNTDSVMGRDSYSSHRQRYLNSGYMIGPIADVRAIFQRALEKIQSIPDKSPWDNGSGDSNFKHHGSDQSIFHEIWGEQEFQREVMRRRHLSLSAKAKGMTKGKPTMIEGVYVEDRLNPPFTHEPAEEKPGKPDEFGIGVDYWSDLGQQTANSEGDARWIRYNRPVAEQATQRQLFDCPAHMSGHIPHDILNTTVPRAAVSDASQFSPLRGWDEVPLYTNICLDTIPVMIHHNDPATSIRQRRELWGRLFFQPHARGLMEEVFERGGGSNSEGGRGGAYTAAGKYLSWTELCPAKLEPELFDNELDL